MKLLLPLGWGGVRGTGQNKEGDQEHPGSGKGSWVAGRQGCREPFQGKEAARLSSTTRTEALPQLAPAARPQLLLVKRPWPGSPLGDGNTPGTGVEAERRERGAALLLFLRGHCLNPVITRAGAQGRQSECTARRAVRSRAAGTPRGRVLLRSP